MISMTKESLADMLDGNEYGSEITATEADMAEKSGLVVVFGYSDDNVELRGAIHDELGCYDGGEFLVSRRGVVRIDDDEREVLERFNVLESVIGSGRKIEALWCKEGDFFWTYKTDIPHATFVINEDGKPFCRGIVFNIQDLT